MKVMRRISYLQPRKSFDVLYHDHGEQYLWPVRVSVRVGFLGTEVALIQRIRFKGTSTVLGPRLQLERR